MIAVSFYLYFSWTLMFLLFNVSVKILQSAFIQCSSPVMNISVGLSFLTNTILAHTKKIKIEITIYTVSVCMG